MRRARTRGAAAARPAPAAPPRPPPPLAPACRAAKEALQAQLMQQDVAAKAQRQEEYLAQQEEARRQRVSARQLHHVQPRSDQPPPSEHSHPSSATAGQALEKQARLERERLRSETLDDFRMERRKKVLELSRNWVTEETLDQRIKEAIDNPVQMSYSRR